MSVKKKLKPESGSRRRMVHSSNTRMSCGWPLATEQPCGAKVDEGNYRKVVDRLPGKFASLKETLRANYDDVLEEVHDEALRLAMAS